MFSKNLIQNHNYDRNILLEELSKISNLIGYEKAVHF